MFFVVNPKSANGKTKERWENEIEPLLKSSNLEYKFQLTEYQNHATEIVREKIKAGESFIVIVSGDGTFNEAVNGFFENGKIINSDCVLGFISSGTGSDVIKTLGHTKDFAEQIEILKTGIVKKIDVGNAKYIDFDGNGSVSYDTEADVKYDYTGGDWKISIGNDGTYRKKDGATELWNFQFDYSSIADKCNPGTTRWPYYLQDNNGSEGSPPNSTGCCEDDGDCYEIFVVVRAQGITAAVKNDYDPVSKNKSIELIKAATGLPNPIPQRIETGFFLIEENISGWQFQIKQFFFSKVHNLK